MTNQERQQGGADARAGATARPNIFPTAVALQTGKTMSVGVFAMLPIAAVVLVALRASDAVAYFRHHRPRLRLGKPEKTSRLGKRLTG